MFHNYVSCYQRVLGHLFATARSDVPLNSHGILPLIHGRCPNNLGLAGTCVPWSFSFPFQYCHVWHFPTCRMYNTHRYIVFQMFKKLHTSSIHVLCWTSVSTLTEFHSEIHLSINLSVCLSICLSACLSIYLSIYLSRYLVVVLFNQYLTP